MAKLIYASNMSLDGHTEDDAGAIDWATLDEVVFAFTTDLMGSAGVAALQNATDAVQLAGAMGAGKESDLERFFRDARVATIEVGVHETLSLGLGARLAAEET